MGATTTNLHERVLALLFDEYGPVELLPAERLALSRLELSDVGPDEPGRRQPSTR